MTKFEKWRVLTDGLSSPDNYINWGWYHLIAAALQRRVWFGSGAKRLYCNNYTILVGPPGVGKGLVIGVVEKLLKHHKLQDPNAASNGHVNGSKLSDIEQKMNKIIQEDDYKVALEAEARYEVGKAKELKSFDPPLLFPVAANATTFEALVKSMAKCIRRKNYMEYHEASKKEIMQIMTHSSNSFCLEEIASLFRKRTEDLVNFLLQAYDCGDYTYDTKTQGKDRIRNCCLNFFAGTTPDFMQETFDDRLLNQGFSSRTNYIYAHKNRKNVFFIPDYNEEQKKCEIDILEHIYKLSELMGQIKISTETDRWLQEWWDAENNDKSKRSNQSLKMEAYYARKNINVAKITAARHFGETLDMEIHLQEFKDTIEVLSLEEKTMHLALSFEGDNPLAAPTRKVLKYLSQSGASTFKELLIELWGIVDKTQLTEILEYLRETDKVEARMGKDDITGQDALQYYIKSTEP